MSSDENPYHLIECDLSGRIVVIDIFRYFIHSIDKDRQPLVNRVPALGKPFLMRKKKKSLLQSETVIVSRDVGT